MFDENTTGAPAEGSAAPVSGDHKLVQLAQAPGEPIGAVEELTGSVTLTRADGSSVSAAPGEPVYLNDVVSTGVGSTVEIRFVDGTRFSLGQSGEMRLDQLVYDPAGSSNELDLSVIQGAFTFVTGTIAGAPGQGMEVRVPVGTIGIRGTAVGGGPDTTTPDPNDYTVVLLPEEGGRVGRIVLTDVNGRSVILDQALEAMDLSQLGMPPGEPVVLTRDQVIDLLGPSVENIEDVLEQILNFQSPEEENPEAGEQRGEVVPTVPNEGGIHEQQAENQTLEELTGLFTLSDESGFNDRDGVGPLGGFTPRGGLGDTDIDRGTGDGDGRGDTTDPSIINPPPVTRTVIIGGPGDDNLDGSNQGPVEIIGLAGNDILIGGNGADILSGGDGDDILDGGPGNDQVFGEGGNDLLIGGSGQGNDLLDGGDGTDTVTYASATQPVVVNLTNGTASGGAAIGNDTLVDIENVIGGQGGDTIIGNAADNQLEGGAGNDLLSGQGGNDTLLGGAGNDTLIGGSGDDIIDGGEGSDTLSGDSGNDILSGGSGIDVALFSGNQDDYLIEIGPEGGLIVTDLREGPTNDGVDHVAADVEVLQFADGAVWTYPDAVNDTKVVSANQVVMRDATNGAAMKTSIEVTAGAVLTLRFNFLDSEPDTAEGTYKDFAALIIGDQVIKLADVDQADLPFAVVGTSFDEQTGYWTYSFTFTQGGNYTLGLVVMNEDDEIYDPGLLVDDISISGGSFAEGFENGLDGWETVGDVTTVGDYGGVSAPEGDTQVLLLVDDESPSASEIEEFLGLPPGALSEVISHPSVSGNVLDNDGAGAQSVVSIIFAGDPDDVVDPYGAKSGNIVTFTAADGSWTLVFDLETGSYSFTVTGPLDYGGDEDLALPFQYAVSGLSGATDTATLTIVIEAGLVINTPPDAVDDTTGANGYGLSTGEDVPWQTTAAALLANDSDPDGDTLQIIAVGNAEHGTVAMEDGVITFTPEENYTGPASFTYTISDGKGGYDMATVHIEVKPANDAPTITSDGGGDTAEITVAENTTTVTTVAANDPDNGQTLTYAIVGGADAALFAIDPNTGELRFINAPNFESPADSGEDNVYEVEVQVSDGEYGTDTQLISVTVTDANDAPVAGDDGTDEPFTTPSGEVLHIHESQLLDNDTDEDGNQIFISSVGDAVNGSVEFGAEGFIIFTPAAGYNGPASFSYTVEDGNGGSSTATVTIDVFNPNDAPLPPIDEDGTLNTVDHADPEGTPIGIQVSATDPDPGDELTYSLTDDAGGIFAIDPTTGIVTLADRDRLNELTGSSTQITVRATDLAGEFSESTFVIQVTNNTGIIFGTPGDDLELIGTPGDDHIVALSGDDVLIGGPGSDILNGGPGTDTADYSGAEGALRVELSDNEYDEAVVDWDGIDKLIGIENIIGTSFDDEISGNSGANTLIGGWGADILRGGGGADVLDGGEGGDTLIVSDLDFCYVEGGNGVDTLVIEGAVPIDLGNLDIRNVEQIDLRGEGTHALTLSAADVLNINEDGYLTILGDDSDVVNFADEGWTFESEVATGNNLFHLFQNGEASVLVDADISTSVPVG